MRVLSFALFGFALVVGCASTSQPPKKPSPCHYPHTALAEARRS
jgi:hypothetical protein